MATARHIAVKGGDVLLRVGWDPTLVRVLYAVVSIVSVAFPGILCYLVLWLVMPRARD